MIRLNKNIIFPLILTFTLQGCVAQQNLSNVSESLKNYCNSAIDYFKHLFNPTEERRIITEAVATGALVGGTIAGIACGVLSYQKKGNVDVGTTAACTGAGALIGGFIGKLVADNQLEKLQNLRLENENMQKLLFAAKTYNVKVREQNEILSSEIARLEKQGNDGRREALCNNFEKAKNLKNELNEHTEEREKLAAVLETGQRKEYEETLKELEDENRRLDKAIKKLEAMGAGMLG